MSTDIAGHDTALSILNRLAVIAGARAAEATSSQDEQMWSARLVDYRNRAQDLRADDAAAIRTVLDVDREDLNALVDTE